MDIIKKEFDLEEITVQSPPVEEEPLIDIKYEEHCDPLLPTVLIRPETSAVQKFFFDAIKLEPNLDLHSDPIVGIKRDDLAFPPASPDHPKSEVMEEVLDFAAGGCELISEEHGCHTASQHIFTINQYRGSTTEHMLQQTVAGISECEVSGICKKESSCSINQLTDLQVNSAKKSLTNPDYKSQTIKRAFPCKICSKVFSYKCNLERHIRIHSGVKSFRCNICGKVFLERGGMKHHLRTHTGEKPSKCDVCGKAFSNNGNLKSHMRTHTGEKPFKCGTCGRAFSNNGSLKHHTHTHTGEKPFKCDICGKLFSLSWNLKYHIRTHLSEKPFK